MIERIAILGAGAWGTALALAARRAGREVTLWARSEAVAGTIAEKQRNPSYLPGIELDAKIAATHALDTAVTGADAILLVCPAQNLRALCGRLAELEASTAPLVICAKGIEQQTGALPGTVVAETLPGRPIAVLSGPSFAGEVARNLPTAITLACEDIELQVSIRSPRPDRPIMVSARPPLATHSRVSSARPRVMSAARALSPKPRPSAMPQAMASTFLIAPPICAPITSSPE